MTELTRHTISYISKLLTRQYPPRYYYTHDSTKVGVLGAQLEFMLRGHANYGFVFSSTKVQL